MSKYFYDLHMHSCLSPCADDDMTPATIAGMATLAGLQVVALTDHNTTKNCPAFFEACKAYGLVPIAGMELTTAEDIHVVCLFETLQAAMDFDEALQPYRIRIPNRPKIFGNQNIVDVDDNITGIEEDLLINATTLPVQEAVEFARSYGASVHPAHIDREGNGIIAILGDLPEDIHFSTVEFHDREKEEEYRRQYPSLQGKRAIFCSDSHYLENIPDAANQIEIPDEPYSSALVRSNLIKILKGEDL